MEMTSKAVLCETSTALFLFIYLIFFFCLQPHAVNKCSRGLNPRNIYKRTIEHLIYESPGVIVEVGMKIDILLPQNCVKYSSISTRECHSSVWWKKKVKWVVGAIKFLLKKAFDQSDPGLTFLSICVSVRVRAFSFKALGMTSLRAIVLTII